MTGEGMRAGLATGIGQAFQAAQPISAALEASRARNVRSLPNLCHLEQAFHFHGHAARQRSSAHSGAGMLAILAQGRDNEIRSAIGDFGMLGEIGYGVDENAQPQAGFHPVQIAAASRFQLRQQVDGAKLGRRLAILQRDRPRPICR